jgi:hypothetical protein
MKTHKTELTCKIAGCNGYVLETVETLHIHLAEIWPERRPR